MIKNPFRKRSMEIMESENMNDIKVRLLNRLRKNISYTEINGQLSEVVLWSDVLEHINTMEVPSAALVEQPSVGAPEPSPSPEKAKDPLSNKPIPPEHSRSPTNEASYDEVVHKDEINCPKCDGKMKRGAITVNGESVDGFKCENDKCGECIYDRSTAKAHIQRLKGETDGKQ